VSFELVCGNCLEWLTQREPQSIHAVLTDPPFGTEFDPEHLEKLRVGSGGTWRVPPPDRKAIPRFTTLSNTERHRIQRFHQALAERLLPVLVPGAHVILASTPLLSHLVGISFEAAGFEKRGELVRLVQTLRGGDRPKGAEGEFPMVSVIPRSAWEPWSVWRKPFSGTVAENLRKYGTGGLRRETMERPFTDVIPSGFPTSQETAMSSHPSLKPQAWLRPLVRALLPLDQGVLLDPFMGSGSTIAAAESQGINSIGIERDQIFFDQAEHSIERFLTIEDDLYARENFHLLMQ
jgi:DNA modification methylase